MTYSAYSSQSYHSHSTLAASWWGRHVSVPTLQAPHHFKHDMMLLHNRIANAIDSTTSQNSHLSNCANLHGYESLLSICFALNAKAPLPSRKHHQLSLVTVAAMASGPMSVGSSVVEPVPPQGNDAREEPKHGGFTRFELELEVSLFHTPVTSLPKRNAEY